MYSKSFWFATFALGVLCAAACSVSAPWRNEPVTREVNLVFVMRDNLLYVPSVEIDGHAGRFLVGTAQPSTVFDTQFARTVGERPIHSLQLNERQSLEFSGVVADLRGVADAIIGANVWDSHAVTIDYRAGLLTYQQEGIHPELMTVFRYSDQPMITISVDGKSIQAIVDTTSPDTVVLPGEKSERRNGRVQVAGTDFGMIDIRAGGVSAARIGNRLLSKFLVSIDYGRREVGLWRDPRIAL